MSYNVDRSNTDTFYRYKMPALTQKIEGKGNGIKTVVTNCADIARALNRPSAYVAKHFGFEMGAQVNMDHAKDRYIVNGAHDAKSLQDKLDIFIRNWVLCIECSNPETKLTVVGGDIISYCKACGKKSTLNIAGRMSQYIVKNAPDKFKTNDIYDDKNAEADAAVNNSPSRKDDPAGWGENAAFKNAASNDDMVKRYLEDITGNMSMLTVGAELVEALSDEDKVRHFAMRLKAIKKKAGKKEVFQNECGEAIKDLAKALLLFDDGTAVWAYCDAFQMWTREEDDGGFEKKKMKIDTLLKTLTKFKFHLEPLCDDNMAAQRMLIGVVETIVHRFKKKLLDSTAHILKQLYDDDILEEKAILEWAAKPTKMFVKKSFVTSMIETDNCKKFLEWLRSSDSSDESSGDEDSSEDESEAENGPANDEPEQDVTASEKTTEESGSGDALKTPEKVAPVSAKPAAMPAASAFDEDFDDDDIDNI